MPISLLRGNPAHCLLLPVKGFRLHQAELCYRGILYAREGAPLGEAGVSRCYDGEGFFGGIFIGRDQGTREVGQALGRGNCCEGEEEEQS